MKNLQQTHAQPAIEIDCSACRTCASMFPTKVPRFSGIVRVIGVILLIPSILGLIFSAIMLFGVVIGGAGMPAAQSDAEALGAGAAFVMFGGFALITGVISLVSGLLGWLLLLTRKVFKCQRCGFVMDRA
ncbi:MAG: hypothetical protein M3367_03345 [Acidobacteriota bacterium]|nr:hypothetical protein [Acidobacteriota bacterium]